VPSGADAEAPSPYWTTKVTVAHLSFELPGRLYVIGLMGLCLLVVGVVIVWGLGRVSSRHERAESTGTEANAT